MGEREPKALDKTMDVLVAQGLVCNAGGRQPEPIQLLPEFDYAAAGVPKFNLVAPTAICDEPEQNESPFAQFGGARGGGFGRVGAMMALSLRRPAAESGPKFQCTECGAVLRLQSICNPNRHRPQCRQRRDQTRANTVRSALKGILEEAEKPASR